MSRSITFTLLLLLLLGASPYESVDLETARRLVRLAREAEDSESLAALRSILERAMELHPDNSQARKGLKFTLDRKTKEWRRSLDDEVAVSKWVDKDPAAGAKLVEDARELERWRSRRYVRLWRKQPEGKRDDKVLEALLRLTPHEPSLHEALGHPKVGDLYVRPELVNLVRKRGTIEKRWAAVRELEFRAEPVEAPFEVPGVPNELPTLLCEGQEFVASYTDEETAKIAVGAQRSYAFVTLLLGTKVEPWAPYRFCLLDSVGYRRMIYALHDDPDEQANRLNFSSYEHEDFLALQADTVDKAHDTIAHTVGYKTMQRMVAPGEDDKDRDIEAYAFMKEGFGYLVSLGMYDSATTWFHSGTESSGKVTAPVPPPKVKTTKSCTRWLQAQARAGKLLPLPQVFGRTLNNLDFLSSMQAWSFLKFLALYDPAGFRNFPLFLREKEEGPYPERVAKSLDESFDTKADELEKRWRAWLVEIE